MSQHAANTYYRSPLLTLIVGLSLVMIFSFGLQIGQMDARVRSLMLQSLEPAVSLEKYIASTYQNWHLRWQIATQGADRLAQLEKINAQYKKQDELLAQLEKENNLLRTALGQRTNSEQIILQFYGHGGSWFVNGGSEEEVQVGDLVLHQGVLIGILQKVYPHYSQVRTVLDQDWRIPVKVEAADGDSDTKIEMSNSEATAEALANNKLKESQEALGLWQTSKGFAQVIQIPQTAYLATGSAILTRGGPALPADLVLATVDSWQSHPDGATWLITADTFVNLSEINLVEVQAR